MAETVEKRYAEVPIDSIVEKRSSLREIYTDEGMGELVESIRANGVVEPVLVAEVAGGYRVIAGTRRVACAEIAGLATVPAIIVQASERWQLAAMWAENSARVDINPLDLGRFIHSMMREKNLSQLEISEVLGKSVPWVSLRLGIVGWPEDVRQAVGQFEIGFGVGRELSMVTSDGARRGLLRAAVQSGCTVRQAQEWRRSWEREQEHKAERSGAEGREGEERRPRDDRRTCEICGGKARVNRMRTLEACEGCWHVAKAQLAQGELDQGDAKEAAQPGDITLPAVS